MRGRKGWQAAALAVLAAALLLGSAQAAGATAAQSAEEATEASDGLLSDPAREYYAAVWDLPDPETRSLLQALGVGKDADSLFSLHPDGVLDAVGRLFSEELETQRGEFLIPLVLLLTLSVFVSFFPPGTHREFAEVTGAATLLFTLIAFFAKVTDRCVAAVSLTSDFIKALAPVYAGIVAFAGNPGVALQYQTLVLAFAAGAGALFASLIPAAAALGTAFAAAGVLRQPDGAETAASLLQKGVRFVMGLTATVFAALLSVRSVLAEAGDTVTAKGLRFLVGGTVPVVGSAIGDALSSLTAGLTLAKSGVGLLGAAAVAAMNLPALCALARWALQLRLLQAAAALCGNRRAQSFLKSMAGVCGTLAAAVCFNAFVYIVAQAVVLKTKGGV